MSGQIEIPGNESVETTPTPPSGPKPPVPEK